MFENNFEKNFKHLKPIAARLDPQDDLLEFLREAPVGTIVRESYGELYEKLESGNWRCLTTLEGVPGSYSEYQTWENITVEYLHDSYLKWQADKVTILFIPEQD